MGGLLYIGLAYPVLTRCWSDELVLAFNTPNTGKSFVCGSANELSEACLWLRVCGGLVFESLVEIPKVTLHLIRNELLFDNFMGLAMMWLIAYVLVDTHKTGLKLVVGTWCWSSCSVCVRVRVFECVCSSATSREHLHFQVALMLFLRTLCSVC